MITYNEICRDLLFKLDDICIANYIEYSIDKNTALSIYQTGDILGFPKIAVMMTTGDAERFITIVNSKGDHPYYVEYFLNNSNATGFGMRFGNSDTTLINPNDYTKHSHHGIYISIKIVHKLIKRSILHVVNQNFLKTMDPEFIPVTLYKKVFVATSNIAKQVIGTDRLKKLIYLRRKKITGIDTWDEIHNHKLNLEKRFDNFTKSQFSTMERIMFHGHGLNIACPMEEFLDIFFTDRDSTSIRSFNSDQIIINTVLPYNKSIEILTKNGIIHRITSNKLIYRNGLKHRRPFQLESQKVFSYYLMAKERYHIEKAFDDEKKFQPPNELSEGGIELIKSYIITKGKWIEKGIAFPPIDEIEVAIKHISEE